MKLKPVSYQYFEKNVKRESSSFIDFEAYFMPYIEKIKDYAIGPYFWLIPDQINMTFFALSKNMHELTPFTYDEWKREHLRFWIENIHPDDVQFFSSATHLSIQMNTDGKNINVNMYLRMLNAQKEYRWVLIQYPTNCLNENNEVVSGLVIITDISHLNIQPEVMMTVMNKDDNTNQFYTLKKSKKDLIGHDLPKISIREREILALMARGLNSPQIADMLFLSYHTVENHKRNIRHKTKVKTSAELIGYAYKYNILVH